MKQQFLSAEALTVGYVRKPRPVLLFENLTLNLKSGELVCFMGPNGVGKSTLIRTLAGLQKSLAGKISASAEHGISVVLTDKIAASNMTVYDLVSYGRYPYLDWRIKLGAKDKEFVDRSLAQVQITELSTARLYELSDGQLQLAMIARALAQDTPLLLLDEPTAHLDLNNRVEVMNLLRSLTRSTGKAILVATHELDLALQTADRIWLALLNKTIRSSIPEDLVLDGSFDEVFRFKGFDLKTGKVQHEVSRSTTIYLIGKGHELLWTQNALERNGYAVTADGKTTVEIFNEEKTRWKVDGKEFVSLESLLAELNKISQ